MPGVFRRRWFPRRLAQGGPYSVDKSPMLAGVAATTAVSTFGEDITANILLVGVSANSNIATFGETVTTQLVGVQATASAGAETSQTDAPVVMVGVEANADSGIYGFNTTIRMQGVQAVAGLAASVLKVIDLIGEEVNAEIGVFSGTGFPNTRVFIIAGRNQKVLSPGLALYPTSDVVAYNADTYVIGSSQNYTIGQVSWDLDLKIQNVDWEFVAPFTHIIKVLNPPAPGTHIQLTYFRWNIGAVDGFQVTSYPVPFSFLNTTIIAENVPPPGDFFIVNFARERILNNPQTVFSLYPLTVDDMQVSHTLYDSPNGFETYRPEGYRVLDLIEMQVFTWNGSTWDTDVSVPDGTTFYVKRLRGIYQRIGDATTLKFNAGDTIPNGDYPQALTYPLYGEGVGKNLLVDGFSGNAAVDYPAAYQIAQSPGDFDPWVTG